MTEIYGRELLTMLNIFDDPNLVALLRYGDEENHLGSGLVMVMSNDEGGAKTIDMGEAFVGIEWREITGNIPDNVTLDVAGRVDFPVSPRNISVWVRS